MKKHKRKSHRRFLEKLILLFLFLLFCYILFLVDRRVFAVARELSHARSKLVINSIIDDAMETVLHDYSQTPATFWYQNGDDGVYSADATEINLFCSQLSRSITESLAAFESESFRVPIGTITGISFLSELGPSIPFQLRPAGSALVDYDTSFTAAGINQINFKIWVNISLEIRIINPIHAEKIQLSRKIMLVDTVIGGEVPEHFFQVSSGSGENAY